jgi:hypothetical protein
VTSIFHNQHHGFHWQKQTTVNFHPRIRWGPCWSWLLSTFKSSWKFCCCCCCCCCCCFVRSKGNMVCIYCRQATRKQIKNQTIVLETHSWDCTDASLTNIRIYLDVTLSILPGLWCKINGRK